jgi:cyclin-dependent kinase-like
MHFKHENIVRLLQVFREEEKLYLVFEYVERTVLEELESCPDGIPLEKLKAITYQMVKALDFLHSHDIVHRDVKPENLLVNKTGLLKVCDFGFARSTLPNQSAVYTDYVSTRWYRSPELLVGDANYDKTVDIWAIGCIYAEMFNGMPLFPGDSDLHTLKLILDMFGDDQTLTDK